MTTRMMIGISKKPMMELLETAFDRKTTRTGSHERGSRATGTAGSSGGFAQRLEKSFLIEKIREDIIRPGFT